MATQKFINNFKVSLAADVQVNDTVIQLSSAIGLPVLAAGEFFTLTLFRLNGIQESGWEVVKVTSRAGVNCTVEREYEGAAKSQFLIADTVVEARPTATALNLKADKTALAIALACQYRNSMAIMNSGVWSPEVTGWHRITLVGASGSGAIAIALNGEMAGASGATTGGTVILTFFATVGESYTLLLGTKGASKVLATTISVNTTLAGANATDSSFIGPGVNMVAGGGKGGIAVVSSTTTLTVASPVGGTASGGDFNLTGGLSGTISLSSTNKRAAAATGGASSPYKSNGNASGNIVLNTSYASPSFAAIATGGAAVGNSSGAVNKTTSGGAATGGAGVGAPSAAVTGGTATSGGAAISATFLDKLISTPLNFTSAGSDGFVNSSTNPENAGKGGGTGAVAKTTANNYQTGSTLLMAGTGALAGILDTNGEILTTGAATRGGASGSMAFMSTQTSVIVDLATGAGGDAYAIIESP